MAKKGARSAGGEASDKVGPAEGLGFGAAWGITPVAVEGQGSAQPWRTLA